MSEERSLRRVQLLTCNVSVGSVIELRGKHRLRRSANVTSTHCGVRIQSQTGRLHFTTPHMSKASQPELKKVSSLAVHCYCHTHLYL
jgi:hypothetical protein